MNPYTSLWTGVHEGDGPDNVHLVLLDNGRSAVLSDPQGRSALHCIRCSACLNVCPVFEHVGGHAYGSTYPGPIGAILSPQLTGIESEANATLPFASTLCGACYDVCPVKINIPDILVHLRAEAVEKTGQPVQMTAVMKASSVAMRSGRLMALAERVLPLARFRVSWLPGLLGGWTEQRIIPAPPKKAFRHWFKENR